MADGDAIRANEIKKVPHLAQPQHKERLDREVAEILHPDWDGGGRVHNWRNHLPETIADAWETFTEAQKCMLYDWADGLASAEHWN